MSNFLFHILACFLKTRNYGRYRVDVYSIYKEVFYLLINLILIILTILSCINSNKFILKIIKVNNVYYTDTCLLLDKIKKSNAQD